MLSFFCIGVIKSILKINYQIRSILNINGENMIRFSMEIDEDRSDKSRRIYWHGECFNDLEQINFSLFQIEIGVQCNNFFNIHPNKTSGSIAIFVLMEEKIDGNFHNIFVYGGTLELCSIETIFSMVNTFITTHK